MTKIVYCEQCGVWTVVCEECGMGGCSGGHQPGCGIAAYVDETEQLLQILNKRTNLFRLLSSRSA
jgi:hypothetical protein